MIDYESHREKLEKALSAKNPLTDKNCIDKIEEKLWWENIIPALNKISIEAANELQEETKRLYPEFISCGHEWQLYSWIFNY